jgi:hypothetical protein
MNENTVLLNKKNTLAAQQAIAELNERLYKETERVTSLHATVSVLMERMNQLEQLVRVQKAMMQGTGPSVRS